MVAEHAFRPVRTSISLDSTAGREECSERDLGPIG